MGFILIGFFSFLPMVVGALLEPLPGSYFDNRSRGRDVVLFADRVERFAKRRRLAIGLVYIAAMAALWFGQGEDRHFEDVGGILPLTILLMLALPRQPFLSRDRG